MMSPPLMNNLDGPNGCRYFPDNDTERENKRDMREASLKLRVEIEGEK